MATRRHRRCATCASRSRRSSRSEPTKLAATIRRRGTVTLDDYRLLTGACEAGLREGLRARGVEPEVEELPLETVLALSKDAYGGAQFADAVA